MKRSEMNPRIPEEERDERYQAVLATSHPVQLAGDQHTTRVTRGALEGAAAQINECGIPFIREHLGFLPTLGYFDNARVRGLDDGESELRADLRLLPRKLGAAEPSLDLALDEPTHFWEIEPSVEITFDRRNFDFEVSRRIERSTSDVVHPVERWAELPPLYYVLSIPVIWGACKFAGAFLERLGTLCADAVHAKISSWVATTARTSKDPTRSVTVEFAFELPDGGRLSGFVLAPPEDIEDAVESGFNQIEKLATVAGVQAESEAFPGLRQAAYFFNGDDWHLGWWADERQVMLTSWFEANPPDVAAALGREPADRQEFSGMAVSFDARSRTNGDTGQDVAGET